MTQEGGYNVKDGGALLLLLMKPFVCVNRPLEEQYVPPHLLWLQ